MKRLITSESVTEGHPDKVCDTISDSVLDALLSEDKASRVACETCVTTGFVLVMGEITTNAYADVEQIARDTIREIGYTDSSLGFSADSCSVMTTIHNQSADIAMGVDNSWETRAGNNDRYEKTGAGDQGMMFGFACRETDEYMPLPIYLAHRITRMLTKKRKSGEIDYIRPDGKSQVTVEYEDGKPVRVDTVVVSTQHRDGIDMEQLRRDIKEKVIFEAIDKSLIDENTKFFINPTGKFVIGGPAGDSGLTGRKIINDTYGGYCPHGGGAFSGKDPTKVDRSAAYMARYAAKNLVAAGLADVAEIQISYAIGVARPVSMYVDTKGTGKLPDDRLAEIVAAEFDFRPAAIIDKLDLLRPIYRKTANYGHFGNPDFPWEKTDAAERLKQYLPKTRQSPAAVTDAATQKIASFKVDHEKLGKGIYISRRDGDTVTVDLRMRKPYSDGLISNAALHSLEHTLATRLRFGENAANVLYVGPMGCQTGFYCVFSGLSDNEILKTLKDAFYYIAFSNSEMPGATKKECGNCLNLSVSEASELAKEYHGVIKDKRAFDLYPA